MLERKPTNVATIPITKNEIIHIDFDLCLNIIYNSRQMTLTFDVKKLT